jgi:8-oxo-dGTP pyrophosphatase MutT (NUDIX family)
MNGPDAARAIPASTVVLLRDHVDGLQVFLLRRPAQSTFAAHAFVFPGGAVDAADGEDETLAYAPRFDVAAAAARMALDGSSGVRESAAFHIAAVREVFEETGLLIGRNRDGSDVRSSDGARLRAGRQALLEGAPLAGVLQEHGLQLAPESLVYAAHFVTPSSQPRRFDTRFFVTTVPGAQESSLHEAEASEGGWYRPDDALDRDGKRPKLLLPPTYIMCRAVARHASAAAAIAALGEHPVDASDITTR